MAKKNHTQIPPEGLLKSYWKPGSESVAKQTIDKYFLGFPYNTPYVDSTGAPADLLDLSEMIKRGAYELYDKNGQSWARFFRGPDGRIYRMGNWETFMNMDGYTEIPYSDVRKMLPRRDYLGGTDYRVEAMKRIPGFTAMVNSRAKAYGVDPNLVLHRFAKEGYLDKLIKEYNSLDAVDQKDDWWAGKWNLPIDGFDGLGLDDAGYNLSNGKYSLLDENATWESETGTNEKGRQVHTVRVPNLNSAIEIMAADLKYRQDEAQRKYNTSASDVGIWANAAFNMGLSNPKLNDAKYVRTNYAYPNYYDKYGLTTQAIPLDTSKKGDAGIPLSIEVPHQYDLGGLIEKYGKESIIKALGGKIYIKPSHRGRLTELKERTGKTEAELYNDGNPAHKKMVVFARNARKWHGDGGLLNRYDMGGDKDNDALGKAIAERVRREQEAKARAEGAPIMGEKPLESEDYLLGAAALASVAPISGTVAAINETTPLWGKAGLRMLRDIPAFEVMDRLPTLVGGKKMTDLGGDATQFIVEKVAGKPLSQTGTMLARFPGELAFGVVPGVAGDMLMRAGSNAVLNSLRNRGFRLGDSVNYLEPMAYETNINANAVSSTSPTSNVSSIRRIGRITNLEDVLNHNATPQIERFGSLTQDAIDARRAYNDIRNRFNSGQLSESEISAALDNFNGDFAGRLNAGLVTRDGGTDFLHNDYMSLTNFYDLRRALRARRNRLGSARVASERNRLVGELNDSNLTPARLEQINNSLGDLYQNSITFGVDAYSDGLFSSDMDNINRLRRGFIDQSRSARESVTSRSNATPTNADDLLTEVADSTPSRLTNWRYNSLDDALSEYERIRFSDFNARRELRDEILSSGELRDAIVNGRTSFPTSLEPYIRNAAMDMLNAGLIDENNAIVRETLDNFRRSASGQDISSLFRTWSDNVFDSSSAEDNSRRALRKLMDKLGTADYKEALRVVDDYKNQPVDIQDIINSAYVPNSYNGTRRPASTSARLEREIYEKALFDKLREAGVEHISPEALVDPRHPDFLKTVTKLRELGINDLPADIHHQYWFQVQDANKKLNDLLVKYNMTPEELASSHPEEYAEVQKHIADATREAGIQSRMLQWALPRGTAIAEHNTSADSYRVMARGSVNSPEGYGYGPGQTSIVVHRSGNGKVNYSSGNSAHQNRIMFDSKGNLYAPRANELNGLFTRSDLEALRTAVKDSGKNYIEYVTEHPEYKPLLENILKAARVLDEGNVKSISSVFSTINRRFGESLPMPEVSVSKNLESSRNYEIQSIIEGLLSDDGTYATYMRRPTISVLKHKYGGLIERHGKDKLLSIIEKMKQSK